MFERQLNHKITSYSLDGKLNSIIDYIITTKDSEMCSRDITVMSVSFDSVNRYGQQLILKIYQIIELMAKAASNLQTFKFQNKEITEKFQNT